MPLTAKQKALARKLLKKRPTMKRMKVVKKYRDVHSFKLQSNQNLIVAQANGRPTEIGSAINMSIASLQAYGNGLWEFTGSINYALNQCAQQSQLCTLFDRYKINGVKVKVIPEFNFASQNGTGNLPVMKIINDFDDVNTNTATLAVWARRGKIYRLNKPFSFYVKPKMAGYAYRTAVTSAYTAVKAPYINCTYPDVPLYGTKFAVKDWNAVAGANCNIRFEFTYFVTFREQLNLGLADPLEVPQEVIPVTDEKEGEPVPCLEVPAPPLLTKTTIV